MTKQTRKEFTPAVYIGLKVHRANSLCHLDFAKVDGDALRVNIPLTDLIRLRKEIDRKLD